MENSSVADSRSDFDLRSRSIDRVETASPIRYQHGEFSRSGLAKQFRLAVALDRSDRNGFADPLPKWRIPSVADSRSDFELRSRSIARIETASPIRYQNGEFSRSGLAKRFRLAVALGSSGRNGFADPLPKWRIPSVADSRSDFDLRSRSIDRVETASPIRYQNGEFLL